MKRLRFFNFILLSLLFLFLLVNTVCKNRNDTIDVSIKSETLQVAEDINSDKFYEMVNSILNNPDYVIIDFRTQTEFMSGYIEGAVNIDFYSEDLKEKLNSLNKDKSYLIYCRSGNRSGKAMNIMKDLGFSKIYNMSGGIIDWSLKNYPLKK